MMIVKNHEARIKMREVTYRPAFAANIKITPQARRTFRKLSSDAKEALNWVENIAKNDGRKDLDIKISSARMTSRYYDVLPVNITLSKRSFLENHTTALTHACDGQEEFWRNVFSSKFLFEKLYKILAGKFD